MDKVIWIEGAKMYLLPDGVAPKLGVDIDIRVGTEFYWYRKAPIRPRVPKKRKQKQVAQPKKVVVHEGEKYYLQTPPTLPGRDDVLVKGVAVTRPIPGHLPLGGWRVYRRNETRTIDGLEYFRVRSGGYRPGDILGNHPPLSVSLGLRQHVEACKIWRPVPVKRVEFEWPDALELSRILSGWNEGSSMDVAAKKIARILDWAKANQP